MKRGDWAAIAVALAAVGAGVQVRAAEPGQAPPASTAAPEYRPNMAEFMTFAVQPRHIKLGLAGKARNWVYLEYEMRELRTAFARIARTIPVFERSTDTAAVIQERFKEPMDSLEAAIKVRDGRRFDAAYAQLTAACNACHTQLNKPFVVIKAPGAGDYPDQVFGAR